MTSVISTLSGFDSELTVINESDDYIGIPGDTVTPIMESLYGNGSKIIALTATDFVLLLKRILEERKPEAQPLNRQEVKLYGVVSIAWTNTIISAFSNDPAARTNKRGYLLK